MRCSCPEQMLPDRTIPERLAAIAAAGFDGVDARYATIADPLWRGAVAHAGLPLASVYSQIRTPALLDATAHARAQAIDDVVVRATASAEAGANAMILVPVFGPARLVVGDPAATRDAERGLLLAALVEIADRIADLPITIVLEPLNRNETHLLVDPVEAAQWCRTVGSPRIATMVDTYHCSEEGIDPAVAIRAIVDRLQLVHLSDTGRGLPGEGDVDFAAVVGALQDIGYDGWLGWECRSIATDADLDALRRSLIWIRDMIAGQSGKKD